MTIRLGTRGSALALAQSRLVATAITELTGTQVELVEITTYGDVSREHLAQIGGTGVFVNALRDALLADKIDIAVHSLKDLPTKDAPGLLLAAVPEREDPRDALVARDGLTVATLPAGARVGTGSPRRAAQLALLRGDLDIVPIRGNVDTRISYVTRGELDAVVVAAAGLSRLGRLGEATELLDADVMLPSPGQGALAVECRTVDGDLADALRGLDDPHTRAAVLAERALLAHLEAGCSAPVGAYATVVQGSTTAVRLTGIVAAPGGTDSLRMSIIGPLDQAAALGSELAADMLAKGAAGLMGENIP
jgi:hydroxymethylbilane synthase